MNSGNITLHYWFMKMSDENMIQRYGDFLTGTTYIWVKADLIIQPIHVRVNFWDIVQQKSEKSISQRQDANYKLIWILTFILPITAKDSNLRCPISGSLFLIPSPDWHNRKDGHSTFRFDRFFSVTKLVDFFCCKIYRKVVVWVLTKLGKHSAFMTTKETKLNCFDSWKVKNYKNKTFNQGRMTRMIYVLLNVHPSLLGYL